MIRQLIFVILLLGGCHTVEAPELFQIHFRVTDDENIPVANATVHAAGKQQRTNAFGISKLSLSGIEGDAIDAQVICPSDSRAVPSSHQRIVLKKLRVLQQGSSPPMEVAFLCIPVQKAHVLIVKTGFTGSLPLQINDKVVAKTNTDGYAQFTVTGPVNEQMVLRIDTNAHPELLPRNPSVLIRLPEKRRFLVFEQEFEQIKPEKVKKKRRRQEPLPAHGPRRL